MFAFRKLVNELVICILVLWLKAAFMYFLARVPVTLTCLLSQPAGIDKYTAPLNWEARVKIALGAARGLAYLHEDSQPRVIHRDFKGSNILLEDDYTPKVSDFGLAKSAAEGGKEHISTRVMGTFGYCTSTFNLI